MRLWITFPDEWRKAMREAAAIEGYRDDLNEYVRQIVREDLKRKGLLGVKSMIDADEDCEVLEGGDDRCLTQSFVTTILFFSGKTSILTSSPLLKFNISTTFFLR